MCAEADEKYKNMMIDEGATVVEEVDKNQWREAAQSVYDEYTAEIGQDLLDKIDEITAE